jgi:hypothetical protein
MFVDLLISPSGCLMFFVALLVFDACFVFVCRRLAADRKDKGEESVKVNVAYQRASCKSNSSLRGKKGRAHRGCEGVEGCW